MRRVTRNVDLEAARDLLERVPRACLAVAGEDGPQALPVMLAWQDGRYLAAIPEDVPGGPSAGQEAVLLVDEGVHFFDLRAVYIRGRVETVEAPEGAPSGRSWFELLRGKAIAWDYGKLREVSDEG
jgi:Pyridoxamine 5'-phosphate oxidase